MFHSSFTPWQIGTLKYLETKIEEWPSRAKLGQAGSNGAKKGLTEPNVAKRAKRGQMGSIGLLFACTHIFMRLKNHACQPRPSDKNWPSYGDFVDSKILMGLHQRRRIFFCTCQREILMLRQEASRTRCFFRSVFRTKRIDIMQHRTGKPDYI